MKEQIKFVSEFPPPGKCYGEDEWYSDHSSSIVIINCESSSIHYPEHWTPMSIKCAFNGKEFYKFGKITYAVDDARFLLLNEGNRYESYIHSESLIESFTVNFTRENIKTLKAYVSNKGDDILDDPWHCCASDFKVFEKLYSHNHKTYGYINAIKNCRNNNYDVSMMVEILHSFLGELATLNDTTSSEIDTVQAKKRATREELYRRLHIAKDYIQSCYSENVSLEQLSRICFLNPFYLLREFKKYFHTTPHKYLTLVRMEEARGLLQKGGISVLEIAARVGFEDASSFSKLFKDRFGISPQVYRKNAQLIS